MKPLNTQQIDNNQVANPNDKRLVKKHERETVGTFFRIYTHFQLFHNFYMCSRFRTRNKNAFF